MKCYVSSGLAVLLYTSRDEGACVCDGRKRVHGKENFLDVLAGEAEDEGASQKLQGVQASRPQDAGGLREQ